MCIRDSFNTASGAAVQLWDNVKEDSQIWLLVEVAEGLYKLCLLYTSRCV